LATGVPAALLLARYTETQLFGVKARDVIVVAAAVLALTVTAVAAGYLPARRRKSPVVWLVTPQPTAKLSVGSHSHIKNSSLQQHRYLSSIYKPLTTLGHLFPTPGVPS